MTALAQTRPHAALPVARIVLAALFAAAAAAIAFDYPVAPTLLGGALLVYGAVLWRWTGAWLVVLPALLPSLDLRPWTGWSGIAEPDLFVLVSVAILLLRAPPVRGDWLPSGRAGQVLLLAIVAQAVGVALGLLSPLGPHWQSANPFLGPEATLLAVKGFATALLLLPFLRVRNRLAGDAASLFGWGMSAGLALVALAVIAERATFPGIADFQSDYRVVGTFSSMHLGGGHIGAYIAFALPFLGTLLLRPRPATLLAGLAILVCAGYALVVTFARAAYGAALAGILVGFSQAVTASRRRGSGLGALILPGILALVVAATVAFAVRDAAYMSRRFETATPDLALRESNWTGGLGYRDPDIGTWLIGMGLGTFPRTAYARAPLAQRPSDFAVEADEGGRFLAIRNGAPFYFGQKVAVEPGQAYRFSAQIRMVGQPTEVAALLCDKLLLYSDNCRGAPFKPAASGDWEDWSGTIPSVNLGRSGQIPFLHRPVELSLFDLAPGAGFDLRHVRLTDANGVDHVQNGDFTQGTEHWFFTDDNHLVWRIKNQYLMILFETGLLGLAAFFALAAAALLGARRAVTHGEPMGGVLAASIVAFLCSGIFDHLLEAPRLAALFYLACFLGLGMLDAVRAPPIRRVTP